MATNWTVGFDADDTLWHNERFFKLTQSPFEALLAAYAPADHLHHRLMAAEHAILATMALASKALSCR